MTSRLAHRKSRKGCLNCKRRKVRCDEKWPICRACDRHSVACTYPDLVRLSQPPSTSVRTPPSYSNNVLSGSETEERRILELRLLHCYLTEIVPSLYAGDHNELAKDVWSSMVPALAFRHPFLLHALLSTAALYLTANTPQSSQALRGHAEESRRSQDNNGDVERSNLPTDSATHQYYLNLAVQKQREVITNLAPENADAATFATLLISNQGFLLMDSHEHEPYALPYRWMLLASATPTVISNTRRMVSENAAIIALIKASEFLFAPNTSERAENRHFFQPLLDWERYPEPNFNDKVQVAYEKALNYLGSIYIAIQDDENQPKLCRRLFGFAPMVPKLFLDFVEKRRPRALVILAHLFAMTKAVDNVWWFRGSAKRHVHGIKSIVPSDWQWAMDWPLSFLISHGL